MVPMFGAAHATLIDRGGGLIYDTVLNVTWLQDANYAKTSGYSSTGALNWGQATTWAANLIYYDSVRNITWDDWRLPQTLPVNGTSYNYSLSDNGSTDVGYNLSAPGTMYSGSKGSEMAFMYYNNLGNQAGGNPLVDANAGPFINLRIWLDDIYWSGTEYDPNSAWFFSFFNGYQSSRNKIPGVYAWAVRSGDVGATPSSVPEPSTMLFLGLGLMGLGMAKSFKEPRNG